MPNLRISELTIPASEAKERTASEIFRTTVPAQFVREDRLCDPSRPTGAGNALWIECLRRNPKLSPGLGR